MLQEQKTQFESQPETLRQAGLSFKYCKCTTHMQKKFAKYFILRIYFIDLSVMKLDFF